MNILINSIGTGVGVAIGTWGFKKYLEPTLEKHHEKLAGVKITIPNIDAKPKDPDLVKW
jgi:hypothetical protein